MRDIYKSNKEVFQSLVEVYINELYDLSDALIQSKAGSADKIKNLQTNAEEFEQLRRRFLDDRLEDIDYESLKILLDGRIKFLKRKVIELNLGIKEMEALLEKIRNE